MRTFIQIISLLLTVISAYFLIKSALSLSVKEIVSLSKPNFDCNLAIAKSLSQQKSNAVVGFVLLLLSFIFGLINILRKMTYDDFRVNKKGVFVGIVVSVAVAFIANKMSNIMCQRWYKQVESSIKTQN